MNQLPPSQPDGAVLNHDRQDRADGNNQSVPRSNPYAAQFEEMRAPVAPNLDAHAPELKSSEMQRMNRRARGLMASLVLLLGFAGFWLIGNLMRADKPPKAREELVTVPAAPQLPTPPPLPNVATLTAPPIPLAQPPLPPLPQTPPAPAPHGPTLMERRMASSAGTVAVSSADAGEPGQAQAPVAMTPGFPGFAGMPGASSDQGIAPNSAYRTKPLSAVSSAQPLLHANVIMVRGTYIRCVLETHIVSDIPGFTSCVVTEPVYSLTGKRMLLAKGSKVLGKYDTEPNGDRIAVIWDRVITPNGIDVNMASPGVDNLGGSGHPGHLDQHWARRITSALLISLFADAFKYELAKHGPQSTTVATGGYAIQSPYESLTAQTLQSLAGQAVRRSANRPDTVTINQGTVVNVYVAKDVDFSAVVASF